MRASEIRAGESYAVTGKGISRARVKVVRAVRPIPRTQRPPYFVCDVEEGQVYTGWEKNPGGHLDMAYSGPGTEVMLYARDFIRPWAEEIERRTERAEARQSIADVMAEMDMVLNALGLSNSHMQLVQTPSGPVSVTVLGIEELRAILDKIEHHEENTDD